VKDMLVADYNNDRGILQPFSRITQVSWHHSNQFFRANSDPYHFMLDALPVATLQINSGFGTAPKYIGCI